MSEPPVSLSGKESDDWLLGVRPLVTGFVTHVEKESSLSVKTDFAKCYHFKGCEREGAGPRGIHSPICW